MDEIQLTAKMKIGIKRKYPMMYVQRVSDKFLSGLPDLRLICFGLSADLEVKLPGKGKKSEPSEIQKKVMEWITASGGITGVAKTMEEAITFADRLYEKGRAYHESRIGQNT